MVRSNSAVRIPPVRSFRGRFTLPGDKSISHRLAILGAMAEGETRLFGFSTALAYRLGDAYRDSVAGMDVLAQMFPYVLTLVIVAGVIGKSFPPAAVGRPYTKQ